MAADAVLAPTTLPVLPMAADVAEAVLAPTPLAVLPVAADAAAEAVLAPVPVAAPPLGADADAEPVVAPAPPIADDSEAVVVPMPVADAPTTAEDADDAAPVAPPPEQTIPSATPAQEEVPSQAEVDKVNDYIDGLIPTLQKSCGMVTDVKEHEAFYDCEPDHRDICMQLENQTCSDQSVSDTQQPTDADDEDVQKSRTQLLPCSSYQQKNPTLGSDEKDEKDESQDVSRAESVKKLTPRQMRCMMSRRGYMSRHDPRRGMMRNLYWGGYMGPEFCSNRDIDDLHSHSLLRVHNDQCGYNDESDHIHDDGACPLGHQFDHHDAHYPSFHRRGRRMECKFRHCGGQRYYRDCVHQGPPGFSPCNPMDVDVSDSSLSDESDHIGDDDTFDHCDCYTCRRAQRSGRQCHWNDQRNHDHPFHHGFNMYDHMAIFQERWSPPKPDLGNWYSRESDLEKEKYNVGAALINPYRWTCFLNCILQCMVHTVPLVLKLQEADHHGSCPRDSIGFCCYCSLKLQANESIKRSGSAIYPGIFVDGLSSISPDFESGVQQDAQEFLRCLLDKLDEASMGPSSQGVSSTERGIATEVFGGSLKSQLHCPECNHCSDRSEPFLDLSLEVNMVETLVDALESFTKVELIGGVKCDGCKSHVNMEKHLKIEQAPEVLVIHLKRFLNDGHTTSKIHDKVKYTLELDIDPFMCSADDAPQKYDLYGVVEHLGLHARGGHYVCCIRSSQDDWYKFNDQNVSRCSEEMVLDCTSYLLFYVKQGSSPWFTSLLEKDNKIPDELKDKEESMPSNGQDGPSLLVRAANGNTLLDESEQMQEGCNVGGISGMTQELSGITGSGGKNDHVDRQGSSPWFTTLLDKENKIPDGFKDKEESTSSDGQDRPSLLVGAANGNTLLDEPEQMQEGCNLGGTSGVTQELSCITGSSGKDDHVDRLTGPLETKEDGSPRGSLLNAKEVKGMSTQGDTTGAQDDSPGKNDNTSSLHPRTSPEPSAESSLSDDRKVGSSEAPSDFWTCIPSEKRATVESSSDSEKEDEQRIGNNGISKGVVGEARRKDNKKRKRRKVWSTYEEFKASRRLKRREQRAAASRMFLRRPWYWVKSKRRRR